MEQIKKLLSFLRKNIVLRYGAPHSVITDHRKCFIADFTQIILTQLEVTHFFLTSNHRQTNGLGKERVEELRSREEERESVRF